MKKVPAGGKFGKSSKEQKDRKAAKKRQDAKANAPKMSGSNLSFQSVSSNGPNINNKLPETHKPTKHSQDQKRTSEGPQKARPATGHQANAKSANHAGANPNQQQIVESEQAHIENPPVISPAEIKISIPCSGKEVDKKYVSILNCDEDETERMVYRIRCTKPRYLHIARPVGFVEPDEQLLVGVQPTVINNTLPFNQDDHLAIDLHLAPVDEAYSAEAVWKYWQNKPNITKKIPLKFIRSDQSVRPVQPTAAHKPQTAANRQTTARAMKKPAVVRKGPPKAKDKSKRTDSD